MKPWHKMVGMTLLGAISFLIGFVVVAPFAVRGIEAQVLEAIKKRGLILEFSDKTIWVDRVRLKDVKVQKSGNIAFDCEVASVTVDIDLTQLLFKNPEIDSIALADGSCDVEINEQAERSEKQPGTSQESTMMRRLLADPPAIEFENLSVKATASGRSVELRLDRATLDGYGSQREFDAVGHVSFENHQLNYHSTGAINPDDGTFSVSVVEPNGGHLALSHPKANGSIEVVRVEGSYRPRQFSVSLQNAELKTEFGDVKAELISVRYPEYRQGIRVRKATVKVPFSFAKSLSSAIRTPSKTTNKGESSPRLSLRGLLRDLRFQVEDSTLEVERKSTVLRLVEQLNTEYDRGMFHGSGVSAGGSFDIDGEWDTVRSIPKRVNATFVDIALGDIPGMPKERSKLPNRGTSGRVDGRLSGSMSFIAPPFNDPRTAARFTGHLDWSDGEIDLEGVSDEPITGLDVSVGAEAEIDLFSKTAEFNATMSTGKITIRAVGSFEGLPLDPEIEFTFTGDRAPCQNYFDSVPAALWGPYRRAQWQGETEPKIVFRYPKLRPIQSKFTIEGYEECEVTAIRATQEADITIYGETTATKRDVEWLNTSFIKKVTEGVSDDAEISVGPGTKTYVTLDKLPLHVGAAAYLSEQMEFYKKGETISFGLIQRAFRKNLQEGRFVYGGSTVTQQLVKNLFLTRTKTIARKLQEMVVSWRMKGAVELDRILELYVNCIEFGPDIYGIQNAAQYYFQKNATELTPRESVFLAMLKPGPIFGERIVKRGKTPSYPWWSDRAGILFERLVEYEILTQEEADAEKPYALEWVDGKAVKRESKKPEVPLLDLDDL